VKSGTIENVGGQAEPKRAVEGQRFQTTRWSIVLESADARSGRDEAHVALAHLCRIYWRPVFAYVSRYQNSPTDAQDLTQEFFVKVIEGTLLRRADPRRGRFRTLLLTALRNFLNDAHAHRKARKRGGEVDFVSWEDWIADAPSRLTFSRKAAASWAPEQLYDVRWAATVVERAQWRLREECEKSGRVRLFEAVRPHLAAERADVCYAELGRQLGIEEGIVKRVIHRLRGRYRELLRDEVARTVEKPEDVEEELRYLCAALAAGTEQ
jgi:RNA polymerase sigma-70 factor (ECF subfamily)